METVMITHICVPAGATMSPKCLTLCLHVRRSTCLVFFLRISPQPGLTFSLLVLVPMQNYHRVSFLFM